ncbi:MAG: ribonuclease III [Proteobacteria bacterium]|nr:ribonuclease III [Pseudomonadota bacterium]MBU1685831.1 ribonuclease III [Pseudomonadota bacterium]
MTYVISLTRNNQDALLLLQNRLGYNFVKPELLQLALIHRSYAFEQGGRLDRDNERMEFLGDAVLDLTVGNALFQLYPEMPEGEMTKLRALLVKESHLARMAVEVDLGSALFLGRGEEGSLGRQKSSILSCAYEAVIGAIFLDGGYGAAEQFVTSHFTPHFDPLKEKIHLADAKSRLQELTQEQFSEAPVYVLEKEEGPDHEKIFTVSVQFRGAVLAHGRAMSKKVAEQLAAAEALKRIEGKNLTEIFG